MPTKADFESLLQKEEGVDLTYAEMEAQQALWVCDIMRGDKSIGFLEAANKIGDDFSETELRKNAEKILIDIYKKLYFKRYQKNPEPTNIENVKYWLLQERLKAEKQLRTDFNQQFPEDRASNYTPLELARKLAREDNEDFQLLQLGKAMSDVHATTEGYIATMSYWVRTHKKTTAAIITVLILIAATGGFFGLGVLGVGAGAGAIAALATPTIATGLIASAKILGILYGIAFVGTLMAGSPVLVSTIAAPFIVTYNAMRWMGRTVLSTFSPSFKKQILLEKLDLILGDRTHRQAAEAKARGTTALPVSTSTTTPPALIQRRPSTSHTASQKAGNGWFSRQHVHSATTPTTSAPIPSALLSVTTKSKPQVTTNLYQTMSKSVTEHSNEHLTVKKVPAGLFSTKTHEVAIYDASKKPVLSMKEDKKAAPDGTRTFTETFLDPRPELAAVGAHAILDRFGIAGNTAASIKLDINKPPGDAQVYALLDNLARQSTNVTYVFVGPYAGDLDAAYKSIKTKARATL